MEMVVRNVHEALPKALHNLAVNGVRRGSRNGEVYEMQEPVTTVFLKPLERVLYYRERDANPFFHFFESLWMLAGRNDVAFPKRFVPRMETFSDDGITFNGAYGFRWRNHFQSPPLGDSVSSEPNTPIPCSVDQLAVIADRLTANHEDRRSVLGMWDASHDLGLDSKDLPCNTTAMFLVRADGKLHMTVTNRSNDIVWGLFGANAVHFSYLLEYMAGRIGVPVGHQVHLSNNYHAYLETFEPLAHLGGYTLDQMQSPYHHGAVEPYPLFKDTHWLNWDRDLVDFFKFDGSVRQSWAHNYRSPFFQEVALPLMAAHECFKKTVGEQRFTETLAILHDCKATDWQWACSDWIEQRYRKWKVTADTGALHG